jgi:2-polyprenyl-3-methyl-5-hydroxy-6-metoxy-1,4-benzoquinol methylase
LNQQEPNADKWGLAALEQRRRRTQDHLAKIAARRESWINRNRYYYGLVNRLLRFWVEPQKKVLSVRCGPGNLLAAVRPALGKGIDICPEIVEIAQRRSPSFEFSVAFPDKQEFNDAFGKDEKFDYILFNDVGDTVDVLQALRNFRPLCHRHSRLLITTYNHTRPVIAVLARATAAIKRVCAVIEAVNLPDVSRKHPARPERCWCICEYAGGRGCRLPAHDSFLSHMLRTDTLVVASISIPNSPGWLFEESGSSSIITAISWPFRI